MRDSFVFYRSFAEVISMIPDAEDKITLLNALIEYGLNGTEPDLQYPLSAMFKQMTSSISGAQKRYQASVENGKKGGRPKTVDECKIRELKEQGLTDKQIAEELKCSISSVEKVPVKTRKNLKVNETLKNQKNLKVDATRKNQKNPNDNVNDNILGYNTPPLRGGSIITVKDVILSENDNPSDETDGTLLEAVPPPPGWEWKGGVLEDDGHHFRLAINKTTREGRGIQLD